MNLGDNHSDEEIRKAHALAVLKNCKYNITAAAKVLGVTRQTLHNWLEAWNIKTELVEEDGDSSSAS